MSTSIRYPAAGKFFSKKLNTRQSEIIIEFLRKNSFNSSCRIADLCLEMSSDFKYNFCFVVEEIFELGHITKTRCFHALAPESTLIDLSPHKLQLKLSDSTRHLFRNAKRF